MTDDNRGSVSTPQDDVPPRDPQISGETAGGDGLAGIGFAAPDAPGTMTDQPVDQLLVPAAQPASPPTYGTEQPPRPGFVPHNQPPQEPRGGWPPPPDPRMHQQPAPQGWRQPPPFQTPPPGGFGGPPPNWASVPAPPNRPRQGPGFGMLALIAVIVALVAGAAGAGAMVLTGNGGSSGGVNRSVNLGGGSSGGVGIKSRPAGTVAGIAQRVLPSVVTIKVSLGNGNGGTGSGFLVNGGYIVTNNHVVAGATGPGTSINVVYNDQKSSSTTATVVGADPNTDVAVIKPGSTFGLPALTLGNSDDLAVGDQVIAFGAPLGLSGSVTSGIVSALNRPVQTSSDTGGDGATLNAIQTDAAINPGNSGGPLVDGQGRVIGIDSAIATLGAGSALGPQSQSGNIGLGFAIPINQAKRVAETIISTGKAPKQTKIGIIIDTQYQGNGVRIAAQGPNGASSITKGGSADRAGLKAGDVITGFNGLAVRSSSDLIAEIRSHAPGDKVKLTYQRNGKETTVNVTLGQ